MSDCTLFFCGAEIGLVYMYVYVRECVAGTSSACKLQDRLCTASVRREGGFISVVPQVGKSELLECERVSVMRESM